MAHGRPERGQAAAQQSRQEMMTREGAELICGITAKKVGYVALHYSLPVPTALFISHCLHTRVLR